MSVPVVVAGRTDVAVALAIDPERAAVIAEHMRAWTAAGDVLHAPTLLRYEVASALTRGIVAGKLTVDDAGIAWDRILGTPIVRLIEVAARVRADADAGQ